MPLDYKKHPNGVYTLFQVASMLGMEHHEAGAELERLDSGKDCGSIPFKFLKVGRSWVCSKAIVDKFLESGKLPTYSKSNAGRKKIWEKGEYVNINIPVPKDLYEEFKAVVDSINSMSAGRSPYRTAIHIAIKEFIVRWKQKSIVKDGD